MLPLAGELCRAFAAAFLRLFLGLGRGVGSNAGVDEIQGDVGVTIFLLFHNLLLLVFSRRVHILFGMCRYDYVSLLLVVHPFHSRMFVL